MSSMKCSTSDSSFAVLASDLEEADTIVLFELN